MAKSNIDLSDLKDCVSLSTKEYSNMPIPNDVTKMQANQILTREVKLIADEEKRIFDQKIQEDRFELDKDHKYWSEKFEEKKFEEEKSLNSAKMEFEKSRLKYDELKLDLEKTNLLVNERSRKDDLIFKYVSLGITTLSSVILGVTSIVMSWKAYSTTLKFKYIDEGMPDKLLENAEKMVNDHVKRYS